MGELRREVRFVRTWRKYRYRPPKGMTFGLDEFEREAAKQKPLTPITVIDPDKRERRLLKGKKLKKRRDK